MTHHPLCYETGIDPECARHLRAVETANLARAAHVIVPSPHTADLLIQDFEMPEITVPIFKFIKVCNNEYIFVYSTPIPIPSHSTKNAKKNKRIFSEMSSCACHRAFLLPLSFFVCKEITFQGFLLLLKLCLLPSWLQLKKKNRK